MSDVTTVAATDSAGQKEASASLWSDARRQLIRNPLFVASFIRGIDALKRLPAGLPLETRRVWSAQPADTRRGPIAAQDGSRR